MINTQTQYKIGNLQLIEGRNVPTDIEEVFNNWFVREPWGLRQLLGGVPPVEVFLVGAVILRRELDQLKIWIGDLASRCAQYHGTAAYEQIAAYAGMDVEPGTVEDWAYIMRRVPDEARRYLPGLRFGHYRAVAPLAPDWQLQRELLELVGSMSVRQFTQYVRELRLPPSPEPPTYQNDRQFELEQELHETEIRYQERTSKLQQVRELVQSQGAALVEQIGDPVARAAVGEFVAELLRMLSE